MDQKQQQPKSSEPSPAKDAPQQESPAALDNNVQTKKCPKYGAEGDNQSVEDDQPRTTVQAAVLVAAVAATCYITDPGENDILLGRGKASIN
jgi:hypothetical protein